MPRIIVMTDHPDGPVAYTEWVSPADFETEHFRQQLAERLAWATDDAARGTIDVAEDAAPTLQGTRPTKSYI
jgi:hypothetical protein